MNSIAHALVGFDPDAVVCSCGRRFEYTEWGGAAHAKELAEQHARLASVPATSTVDVDTPTEDPLREALIAATPAWADTEKSRVVYGAEPDAAFVSRDLAREGTGMKVILDAQAVFRTQPDGAIATNQTDPRVVAWIGRRHHYVDMPVATALGTAVDLLVSVAAAEHQVKGDLPPIREDLDTDGSLLGRSITFESDRTKVVLVNDHDSDAWSVYVNVSDLEGPLSRGRDLLRALATAIAVGEQLNAEGTATS